MLGRGKSRAKTKKATVIAAERRKEIFALRKLGLSYADIAAKVGVSEQAACKCVRAELARISSDLGCDREAVRSMELERLDMMLTIAMQHISQGSLDGIDRALKIQQRRAAYLGLDAPTKVDSRLSGDKENPLTVNTIDMQSKTDEELEKIAAGGVE